MVEEPVKPMNKKVQIMIDEEIALKLQAEINEEERIARLAERLQAEEHEQFTIEQKATLLNHWIQDFEQFESLDTSKSELED
ncbi:hypothetical protein Tco_0334069, partial [Tanacetum coccineum]